MNVTFLIGNGFDRNLGLATTYADFVKHYKKTEGKTDVLKKFHEHIKENEELWSAAEIEMGQFTAEFEAGKGNAFSECHADFCEHLADYLKGQEKRIDYAYVANRIEQAFSNVNSLAAPFPTQERDVINSVLSGSKSENTVFNFINYNYTDTLDQCISHIKGKQTVLGSHRYNNTTHNHAIGDVLHVHGTVAAQMVFGVNDKTQIAKPEIFDCEYGDLYENALIKKQANEGYGENTDAKAKGLLDKSQVLYIYGMSIGETDKLWWERVCQWLNASSSRHLIVFRYSMPPRGVIDVAYKVAERDARREITRFAKLDETQKNSIEGRIHITNFNIFSAIKDVADKRKSTEEQIIDAARDAVEWLENGGREELVAATQG